MHHAVADRADTPTAEQLTGDAHDLLRSAGMVQSGFCPAAFGNYGASGILHRQPRREADALDLATIQQRFVLCVVQRELDAGGAGVENGYAVGHVLDQATMLAPPST